MVSVGVTVSPSAADADDVALRFASPRKKMPAKAPRAARTRQKA
ncbi:hypothetical protein BH10ACT6_BH10ACT6_00820 [soil metagenome]